MLFNDLADDQPDQNHQYQQHQRNNSSTLHMRNNSSTLKISNHRHQNFFEEQDKLPPVIVVPSEQRATVSTPSMQGSW